MRNIQIISCMLLFTIAVNSCKEELMEPQSDDGSAPGPVSNVNIVNLPGGARINYTLPSDKDLMYVVAEYSTNQRDLRNVKTSFYNNFLEIDGFGDVNEYEVKLYAVDKGENRSAAVIVKVKPLTPPVQETFASLKVKEDFGGVNVKFKNPKAEPLVIVTLRQDAPQKFVEIHKHYTSDTAGSFSVRGMDPVEKTFGIYVIDRWDNSSDTIIKPLIPIFETKVPDNQTTLVKLSGDVFTPRSPWKFEYIWDGNLDHTSSKFLLTAVGSGMPQSFTMDLGKAYRLSRYIYYPRREADFSWYAMGPQRWELWGSLNPNPNGTYDASWVKIMDCEHIKPSGLPPGENTDLDLKKLMEGVEFLWPENAPPVRYLRWKTISAWAGTDFQVIGDLMFYGQEQ